MEVDGAGWRWVHGLVIPILNVDTFNPIQDGSSEMGLLLFQISERAVI